MKYFFLIAWFVMLGFVLDAQGHSYVFQHFNSKDGLESDKANCILQDSKGYYWIGSDNGLQRFDGKYFTSILPEKSTKSHLLTPIIITDPILEDKDGNIWGQSKGFIVIYHPLTGKSDSLRINDDSTKIKTSNICYFCKDAENNMWIATYQNLYKYNFKLHKAILFLHLFQQSSEPHWPKLLYDPSHHVLWITREHEILMINPADKTIRTPFKNTPVEQYGRISESPVALFLDSKNNLWFSDWEGIVHRYNIINFQTKLYDVPLKNKASKNLIRSPIYSFIEDKDGLIWMGSLGQSFLFYDEQKDLISELPVFNSIPYSFHYERDIFDLLMDNEGNIIACTDKGLSVFSRTFRNFITIDENNIINPVPEAYVTSIFETSEGDILVGTWGNGLLFYDNNFHLKKHFFNNSPTSLWRVYGKNMVCCIAEDHIGNVWIAYQSGLLGRFISTTQSIHFMNAPELEQQNIRVMKCDSNGILWLGLNSGSLIKWDSKINKFRVYPHSQLSSISTGSISDILITSNEEMWISTLNNGFFRFDPVNEKIAETYPVTNQDSSKISLYSLTQLNDSIIGISTSNSGILFFNHHQNKFTSLTTRDGLPFNNISGIATDRNNNLWVATHRLLRVNSNNHEFALFGEEVVF